MVLVSQADAQTQRHAAVRDVRSLDWGDVLSSFPCSHGGGPDLVAFVSSAGEQQEKAANGPGQHRDLGEKRESSQGSVWCCQRWGICRQEDSRVLSRDGGLLGGQHWGETWGDMEHQAEECGVLQMCLEEADCTL